MSILADMIRGLKTIERYDVDVVDYDSDFNVFYLIEWCNENVGIPGQDWELFTIESGYQFVFKNLDMKIQFILRWAK